MGSRLRHVVTIAGFVLLCGLFAACSDEGGGSNSADAFRGTWVENTDGSQGLRVVISPESLTVSGPGVEELHSGFIQGGAFSETVSYTITKDSDGRDIIDSMIRGQECTMLPVSSSLDFHCFAGTELFLHRRN